MNHKTTLYLAHELMRRILVAFAMLSIVNVAHADTLSLQSEVHSIAAIAVSGVFVAAFAMAILLWLQARRLHHLQDATSCLDQLPPVLTLEKMLFRLLDIGFVLLTFLIVSGMVFGEGVWGQALILKHKVVFTLVAWLVFAILLVGHYIKGWRGLRAVRATIIGFSLLFLAYVGTHVVIDFILKRG